MREVAAPDAKTHLPQFLDAVEHEIRAVSKRIGEVLLLGLVDARRQGHNC